MHSFATRRSPASSWTTDLAYSVAADAILIVHTLFVAFVVLGVVAIFLGQLRRWDWVRSFRFRVVHLGAIALVVMQSWVGAICPLTTWEMRLRELAGEASYGGSFVQHWLHRILFYSAPEWVFVVVYTSFGALVAASWFAVPPGRAHKR